MSVDFLVTAFVTLFVVIDPIGTTPIFVALTQGMTEPERRGVARRACAVALAVLVLFGLFGEAVLGFIGISMPAFRIAGGILLFLIAIEMLFGRRSERRQTQSGADEVDEAPDAPHDDPSIFPIAIPLLAGPGGIASVILLTDRADGDVGVSAAVFGTILAIIGVVFALFRSAAPIERALGPTGILVVTRLLGMLLAALSVQFVIDGVAEVLPTL